MGFVHSLFLLFLFTNGVHAFVFSCNEVLYKLINSNVQESTRYVCLVADPGYQDTGALKSIYAQSDKVSTSFADILNATCVERPVNGPWKIVADLPVTLDCNQEFSLIFTSATPKIVRATSTPASTTVDGELIIVYPKTRMRFHKMQCTGNGNVTFFTGAGNGETEDRFPMISWRQNTTASIRCTGVIVEPDYFVLWKGKEDQGEWIFNLDSDYSWSGIASFFELQYISATELTDLWNSQDTLICEFAFGEATPVSTPAPLDNSDPYCGYGLDKKFGMPDGWDPTEIWLDVVIILDITEAMGDTSIIDASTLIESFFGSEDEDVLNTDSTAQYYTRVGLIAMSDTAEVLYNLNMTKNDNVNVKTKKGVKEINVVDAFYAAQSMLKDGRENLPDRATTRPVIYYMTDSDPKIDLSPLNAFKLSDGVIIVNDFIEAGVFERPGLKNLASPGYYSTDIQDNYMDTIQLFCKANCYCRKEIDRDPYAGNSADPAVTASGGCYHAVPTGVQYNNLKTKNCEVAGGKIASVHDADKNAFLSQLMHKASPKSDYFWIGQTKSDAGWTWEDQSTNPYTNWDTVNGEPSTASVAKCTYVDMTSTNLYWGAGNCNTGFPGVCEYAPCSVGNNNC